MNRKKQQELATRQDYLVDRLTNGEEEFLDMSMTLNRRVKMNNKEYHEYYTRRNKKRNIDNWEEIPDEDLWEDGELESEQVKEKLYQEVVRQGVWKLIREIQ